MTCDPQPLARDRIYHPGANPALLALIDRAGRRVLDVGCGAGENAAALRARDPHKRISGITASSAEAELARDRLDECWVTDVESELPASLEGRSFDILIFSHVLEHLRDPSAVVRRYAQLLERGGQCLIAVPNVLFWRQRWEFVRGRFDYQREGTLDATHLRFFTYDSAARFLLAQAPELELVRRTVSGCVPLWFLRHRALAPALRARLDEFGTQRWPNLFGDQVLLVAHKA